MAPPRTGRHEDIAAPSGTAFVRVGDANAAQPLSFCGGEHAADATRIACRAPVSTLAPLASFAELRQLERVSIESDDPRQPFDASVLRRLPSLSRVGLTAPGLIDIAVLASLPELAELSLAGCERLANVAPLAGLSKLTLLDLAGSAVRDVRPLVGLPLTTLNLSDTEVVDIAPLAKLKQLRALNLSGLAIHDVSPLSVLADLEELDLGHTNVKDLAPLRRLTKLRRLVLWHSAVVDIEPLASLSALEALYLDGTKVRAVSALGSLGRLVQLGVSGAVDVDADELQRVQGGRPLLVVER